MRHVRLQRALYPRIGTRKLHYLLNRQADIRVGRDHLFDVLRQERLLIQPKRAYRKTTQSHHRFYCHPNLIKKGPDQITAARAEQLWVADITYAARGGIRQLSDRCLVKKNRRLSCA